MNLRVIAATLLVLILPACAEINTKVLSRDALNGRNNNTSESTQAQDYLIAALQEAGIAGLNSAANGDAAYRQSFLLGTNILAIVPGTDLADEYVMIGAHYDHITNCAPIGLDTLCNGATDNAAGVAAALDIAFYFSLAQNQPRRSVIVALWDREEDGLQGSAYYVANPLVPLASTVAYINFDILGANLLPSLKGATIAVGAESGGAAMVSAVTAAAATETLAVSQFSAIFGQNRSDYAVLIGAGVPTVFFTDSTGPCYHTAGDDFSVVDFEKLTQQTKISLELAKQLANAQLTPSFNASAPLATYADAVSLNSLIQQSLTDIDRFSPGNQANIQGWAATMATIVSDGQAGFSAGDINTVLSIAVQLVSLLSTGECDGFV